MEFILQVANNHFRSGGTPQSFVLGRADALWREQRLRHMLQVVLAAAMTVMAVSYAVFFIWDRGNKTLLYFALFATVLAVRTGVIGEMPLLTVFPNLPWEAHLRMEYASNFLAPLLFMAFLQSLFPLDVMGWVARVVYAVTMAGSLAAVALPTRFISLFIPAYRVFIGAGVLYSMGVLVVAFRRRREAAEFFLAGGLVFLVCVILALLRYNQLWITFDWLPVGTGVLLLFQFLTVARRYALAFRRVIALSSMNARLLDESRQLLEERQRLHQLLGQQDAKLRRDVAEILHGRAQARLHAAWSNAERAGQLIQTDPAEARRLLVAVQDLIDLVREQDIREASHRLHPVALGAGLVAALDSLLRPLQSRFGVHLEVDPALDDLEEQGSRLLGDDVRTGLYRITEEALNNIRRHAQAKNVSVTLRCVPGAGPLLETSPVAAARETDPAGSELSPSLQWIELVVADDGVGIDVGGASHGLGLRLIAARVAELGGKWEIGTPPEGGTRLRVVVPVRTAVTD